MNPDAVDWIENSPDSPYHLEYSEISHKRLYCAGTVYVLYPRVIRDDVVKQPMIWLKDDVVSSRATAEMRPPE